MRTTEPKKPAFSFVNVGAVPRPALVHDVLLRHCYTRGVVAV
jgi:hypothetical protein